MATSGYVSGLPEGEVERIRQWHERAYQLTLAEAADGPQTHEFRGRTFVVPQQVHPVTGQSDLIGDAVLAEVRAGDRVLDMGTGCGLHAVLAAGTAERVVAVDINPAAVDAARANAARNGVADRVDVRVSDVFSAVDGEFDLIIWDPPFRWFTPRDYLEMATADPGYQALTRFFHEVDGHLAAGGRLLIFFGTSGDLAYLHRLIDEAGLRAEVVAHRHWVREDRVADYYTYRIARR